MKALVALAVLLVAAPAIAQESTVLKVGQVWSVRDMSPDVRFTIFRIEPWGDTRVVHGSVTGYGRVDAGGRSITPDGGHIPLDEDAVRRSVLQLKGTGAKPTKGFEEGYAEWRDAKGGAFTLTIAEAIAMMIDTVRTGRIEKE